MTAVPRSTSPPTASRSRTAPTGRSSPATSTSSQATLALDTARLTVSYSSGGGIQIRRLDAGGGVVVRSPSETARGNFGIYDLDKKLITLVGAVQLNRGGSQVMGSRLVIDLDSGRAVIDGGAPGVGQSGGRVTGHFTVPKKTQLTHERRGDHRANGGRGAAARGAAGGGRARRALDRQGL